MKSRDFIHPSKYALTIGRIRFKDNHPHGAVLRFHFSSQVHVYPLVVLAPSSPVVKDAAETQGIELLP